MGLRSHNCGRSDCRRLCGSSLEFVIRLVIFSILSHFNAETLRTMKEVYKEESTTEIVSFSRRTSKP